MSYLNAPGTKLLATRCAICGTPLLDAKSVDLGIGPDCRRKHGYDVEIPEEARIRANKVVHDVALSNRAPAVVAAAVVELALLGLDKLAGILLNRAAAVVVDEADGRLSVRTPYDAGLVAAMQRVAGRQWDKSRKVNTFPTGSRAAVWAVLKRHFPGQLGAGPKGAFLIPVAA